MESTRKPILGIVGPYPPNIGGTAAFLNAFVPRLTEKGFQVLVFNTQKGNPGSGLTERFTRLIFFFTLALKILASPCKVIHCHTVNWENLLGHAIILFFNRPFKKTVLTLHAGDLLSRFKHPQTHILARVLLRLPHVITTVTPELREAAIKMGVKHVSYISNALSFVPSQLGPVPDDVQDFMAQHEPNLITVGALEKVYGIDILIQAIPYVQKAYPNVGVVVIAYKSIDLLFKAKVNRLISSLNLLDRVIFPDKLPDVLSVIKLAQVFLRPTWSDGDSISVREAMGLNVPVIASDTGFRPEGVFLFPPGNIEQLANVILRVLSDPPEGDKPLVLSNQIIQEYIHIYDSVMKNNENPSKRDHV